MKIMNLVNSFKLKHMIVQTSFNSSGKKVFRGIVTKKDWDINEDKWSWENNASYQECKDWNNSELKKSKYYRCNFNQAIIYLDPQFIVFDTDNEQPFELLKNTLQGLNLYHPSSITESYSGRMMKKHFKRHFWFKVSSVKDFNNFRGWSECEGWDLFHYGNCKIAEFLDTDLKEDDIPIMNINTFNTVYKTMTQQFPSHKAVKEEKVKKETISVQVDNFKYSVAKMDFDENLKFVLDNINKNRWTNFKDWLVINMIAINTGIDMKIIDEYSKQSPKYDAENNQKILKNLEPKSKGYTLLTLYKWLKEDNPEAYQELLKKGRKDVWSILVNMNENDCAKYFYKNHPFIYSYCEKNDQWYEINKDNIYIPRRDIFELARNRIMNFFQDLLKEELDNLDESDDTYKAKNKVLSTAYVTVGSTKFNNGVINCLKMMYWDDSLIQKLNSNSKLFAFNNLLFDFEQEVFRKIERSDYISITANYDINSVSNTKAREFLKSLLHSIFENKKMSNYWLRTTGFSLFTNKLEKMYLHCGNTRNGKGLLATLIQKSIGGYFKTAESTFLNTSIKAGCPNPTLATLVYARYLSISEPETNTENSQMNVDFVKKITGNDLLTTRALFKDPIEFYPKFVCNICCNGKPELNKIDQAIMERIEVINYPFQFVDNPKHPNERKINRDLKDMINDPVIINEFCLMLIEAAIEAKKMGIEKPKEVIEMTKEYFEENNPVKAWLRENFEFTRNDKDLVKCSDLFSMYSNDPDVDRKFTSHSMREAMKNNNYPAKILGGICYYRGLIQKKSVEVKEEVQKIDIQF